MTDRFFDQLTAGQPEGYLPVSPFIHVNFVQAFFRNETVDVVAKTPEVYDHFGFDLVHRNCTPASHPFETPGEGWTVEKQEWQDDDATSVTSWTIQTPDGRLTQIVKRNRISAYDYEESAVEYLIRSRDDFDLCRRYQPVVSPIDVTPVHRARQVTGTRGLLAPWVQGAFNFVAFYYCRLEDLLLWALMDESFYREMMEYFLNQNILYVDQILAAGPEAVSYAANIANGKLISPAFFRKYIFEYEKRLIDHIQLKGVAVLFHNCGHAQQLLPLYANLGMAAYESLTAPPYGDTVLPEALRTFPESVTLCGNLDQIHLLRTESVSQVEASVEALVAGVRQATRKHFIIATTDYFSEDTPYENIVAFARAARNVQKGS